MINNANKRMSINTEPRDGEYSDVSRRSVHLFYRNDIENHLSFLSILCQNTHIDITPKHTIARKKTSYD